MLNSIFTHAPCSSVGLQMDFFFSSSSFTPPTFGSKNYIYVFLLGTENAHGGHGSFAEYVILFNILANVRKAGWRYEGANGSWSRVCRRCQRWRWRTVGGRSTWPWSQSKTWEISSPSSSTFFPMVAVETRGSYNKAGNESAVSGDARAALPCGHLLLQYRHQIVAQPDDRWGLLGFYSKLWDIMWELREANFGPE